MRKTDPNLAEIGLGLGRQNSERQWEEDTLENSKRIKKIANARKLKSRLFPTRVYRDTQFWAKEQQIRKLNRRKLVSIYESPKIG